MPDFRQQVADYFANLQDVITTTLGDLDGTPFREDAWNFEQKGGGRSRVLAEGTIFEKAGVNFSQVGGEFTEEFAKSMPGEGREFSACGISLVLHPRNPYVPTVHANFRFITKGENAWFGGGADLTPYYPFREDCIAFHQVWRDVCQRHAPVADYQRLKTWCDEYFHLPHRKEARGIGGIFFDYLKDDPEAVFDFVKDAGDHFLEAYVPIVKKRKDMTYGDRERMFQQHRRGRYVEFNLVYDRGTLFGLKTSGRIESILMSLPPIVRWTYDYQIEPGSREAELLEYLEPRDWASQEV
ncbi:Coproporphyrinogen-III oxidase, aerobic [Planctomycetes bacterium Pan216]|uniref:coproporphyrinogen oxidase n=1 Tax=Kolteria novifilia TaxID=2527975 RepID=A0A518BCS2_9BACT|nr:Coproporphyrinogen-III oxidase, aerobic [Planctomycetes bacterium Pan216]